MRKAYKQTGTLPCLFDEAEEIDVWPVIHKHISIDYFHTLVLPHFYFYIYVAKV